MSLSRKGACNPFCGRCCTLAAFQGNPAVTVKFPGVTPNGECQHLSWQDGKAICGIYETRPELCREFPPVPLAIATIPMCGYRFISLEEVTHAS